MLGTKILTLLPLLSVACAASIRLDARASNGTSSSGNSTSSGTNSTSSGSITVVTNSNTSSLVGPYGLDNANCQNITLSVPVNITLSNFTNVDDTYSNTSYITKQFIEFTTAQTNWTSAHVSKNTTFNLNQTFSIAGYYCEPKQGAKNESALINLVHGIGFDASYWNYGLAPEYSVVKHAASYGYSTFRYDRLGTGNSETPKSGFEISRSSTEVAILENILGQLRNSTTVGGKKHDKIVGVGHSYGSVQTQAVSKQVPGLQDAIILTGFTTNSSNLAGYLEAASYSIANKVFPDRLASKPDTWLVTGSNASDTMGFLYPPYYSEASFDLARGTEQAVTLGSLFSIGDVGGVASNFTGPVGVINGAKDFIFCTSNCWAGPNGTDIPSGVKQLYPQAKNFTSYIVENTGHGITAHYSQPTVAHQIVSWIQSQGL